MGEAQGKADAHDLSGRPEANSCCSTGTVGEGEEGGVTHPTTLG